MLMMAPPPRIEPSGAARSVWLTPLLVRHAAVKAVERRPRKGQQGQGQT
jgi:hypothetical protein